MIDYLKGYFFGKHSKSIIYLLILNFIGIVVNLLYVPLMIDILNTERYGIWLTITTIISWVGYFDIGLGHGLRNRVAESLATNDISKASSYVSTAYFSILLLVIFLIFVSIFISPLIPWELVLNAPPSLSEELSKLMFWILIIFVFDYNARHK